MTSLGMGTMEVIISSELKKKKPFEVALAIIPVIMPFPEEDRELNSESGTMRHCYANVRVI